MQGPPLQWTTVPPKLYEWLRMEGQHAMSELVKLPYLTELHPTALDDPFMPDAVDSTLAVLPFLPALQRLRVGGSALSLDQRPSHIDRGLLQLHALPRTLTALCLRMSGLQTAQLRRLLSLTPNLQVLALVHYCHFGSLSFVQPVARTLHSLRLLHCGPMPPQGHVLPQPLLQSTYMSPVKFMFAQLEPLRALTNLTELDLRDSLHPLTAAENAQLHPPSSFLPSLRIRDGAAGGEFADTFEVYRHLRME